MKKNVAFFFVWFSLFVLTRVIGRGPNIVIFFNGRQNKTFELSSKFFHNGRLTIYLLISSAKRQVFLLFFNHAEAK